jgi:hypothetical protein
LVDTEVLDTEGTADTEGMAETVGRVEMLAREHRVRDDENVSPHAPQVTSTIFLVCRQPCIVSRERKKARDALERRRS